MKKAFALPSVFAFAVAGLPQLKSELIIGLTVQNTLVSFDSATPGTTTTLGSITGLTAGDTLVGIDRRPQLGPNDGRLYAFGVNLGTGSARIYTLSESTAAATLISTLAADPADVTPPTPFTDVQGSSFGVDFNPIVDRLRVVSNTGQNLRLNVDNGLTQLDVPLAYGGGDPNFGDSPFVTGIAYSNNFGGAVTTVLRGVDIGQDTDALVEHANPNGGLLQTLLSLPFNSASDISYDVSGLTGTPYFSTTSAGAGPSSFFAAGPGGVALVGTIGGGVALRGIAAPVGSASQSVPDGGQTLLSLSATMLAICLFGRGKRAWHTWAS